MEAPPLRGGGREVGKIGHVQPPKDENHDVGTPNQKKKGNNEYGNIGRPKCQHCRKLKTKCIFVDVEDDCQKCKRTGKECGPKVLSKARATDGNAVLDGQQRAQLDFAGCLVSQILRLLDPRLNKSPQDILEKIKSDCAVLASLSEQPGASTANDAVEDDGDEFEDDEANIGPEETELHGLLPDYSIPQEQIYWAQRLANIPPAHDSQTVSHLQRPPWQHTVGQLDYSTTYQSLSQQSPMAPRPQVQVQSYVPLNPMNPSSGTMYSTNPVPSPLPYPMIPIARSNSNQSMPDWDAFTTNLPPPEWQGPPPPISTVPRLSTPPRQQYGQLYDNPATRNVEPQLSGPNNAMMYQSQPPSQPAPHPQWPPYPS